MLDKVDITNRVSASSTTVDPDSGDNQHTEITDVLTEADLSLDSMVDVPDPVFAGVDLTYTIRLSNHGPSDAQDVTLTDALPIELEGERYCVGENCTVNGSSPIWNGSPNLGVVPAGGSLVVRITARVNPSTPKDTVLHNEATLSSSTTDPGPRPNTAAVDTTVDTEANIDVTKTDGPVDPVTAGNVLVYALRVTNHGPSDAQSIQVTDDLPPQLTGSQFCVGPQHLLSQANQVAGCFNYNQPWTGSVGLGALPPEQSQVVRIHSTVLADTPDSPPALLPNDISSQPVVGIRNEARVTSTTNDSNPAGNIERERTDVITRADLKITNVVQNRPADNKFVQGGNVTYHLTVDNFGPSYARNVTVSNDLPQKMTFVGSSHGGAVSGSAVVWNLGTITPADPPVTLTLTLSPTAAAGDPFVKFGGQIGDSATVSASTADPGPEPNTASDNPIKVCTKLGDDAPNDLMGTTGDDWICGRGGNDILNGIGGNDVVQGNDGNDSLDDTGSVPGHSNGNDILEAGNGSDTVNGGNGADRLSGGFFSESVTAGEGTGADDGTDTLTYREAPEKGGGVTGVSVRLREGQAFHLQTGNIVRDELWKNSAADNTFEHVVGSEYSDDLIGDNDPNNLAGRGCASTVCTTLADSYYTVHPPGEREQGGDVITAAKAMTLLTGASGNDALRGGAGADTLNGGTGNDLLSGGLADGDNDGVLDSSPDTLDGGDGWDLVWYENSRGPVTVNLASRTGIGPEGTDSLTAIENIKGSLFGDDLTGQNIGTSTNPTGRNSIDGSSGVDTIRGAQGDDTSLGIRNPDDPNTAYPGLSGGAGADTINGNSENDFLVGGSGTDTMNGGAGNMDYCRGPEPLANKPGCEFP